MLMWQRAENTDVINAANEFHFISLQPFSFQHEKKMSKENGLP